MKKIFRKNQLVITALALMIAVAGYFSYMNNNMDDGKLQTAAEAANAEVSAGELEEDYDISDEDVLQNEIFTAEEPDGTETAAVTDGSAETAAGTEGEPAAEGTGADSGRWNSRGRGSRQSGRGGAHQYDRWPISTRLSGNEIKP